MDAGTVGGGEGAPAAFADDALEDCDAGVDKEDKAAA